MVQGDKQQSSEEKRDKQETEGRRSEEKEQTDCLYRATLSLQGRRPVAFSRVRRRCSGECAGAAPFGGMWRGGFDPAVEAGCSRLGWLVDLVPGENSGDEERKLGRRWWLVAV